MATLDKSVARCEDNAGLRLRRIWKYTGPASYATGGDAIAANAVGLGVIENFPAVHITDGTTLYVGVYNFTTGKLVIFDPATGLEVANATVLTTFIGRFEVIGK